MEKKNMVLLTVIAVATLLVAVVGATFAYFTATITDDRGDEENKGQAAIQAAQTPGSLIIEKSQDGFGSFNEGNVYPGHKELIQLTIKSDTTNTTDTYFNIVYTGTNTFPNNKIKFTLYESKESLGEVAPQNAFDCTKESEELGEQEGKYKLYETCTLKQELGVTTSHPLNPVYPKNFSTSNGSESTKTILNGEHPFVITGDSSEKILYYYVVVEYVNDSNDQSTDEVGKSLSGNISVEIAARDDNAIKDDDTHLTKKSEP